jgi:hypothetical protein
MSAKTKSKRLQRLLSHGYYAPELPPCFVSDDLAKFRKWLLAGIEALPRRRDGNPDYYGFITEPVWFYFPRFGKDARKHGIPNPVAHLLLSRTIADNYVALRRKARASMLSLSPPVFDWNGNRALVRPSIDLHDDFRVKLSSRREAYIAADVRAFFHSIYTHAIAWAIHGKEFAKQRQNRGFNHYGNLIDLLCRNAQDGQTIGLPVGPDTSRLIAEVVASAMDVWLQDRLSISDNDASRYIDDYTLSSGGGELGEELLAALRQGASVYELELNSEKSAIISTSHRQSTGWQQAARAHIPRVGGPLARIETSALQHFFYELGRLCQDHPDINVEKFGLQFARSALICAGEWGNVQAYLISAYRRNSTLISLLVELCILRQVAHRDVGLDDLKEFIENRIPVLARANRIGEAVWLMFLALRLRLTLQAGSLAPLFSVDNAPIALLITCLNAEGLVQGMIDRARWDNSLTAAGLRSPMWLYAYEAVTRGYLPGANDDFITRDPYFSLLRTKRIQFLEIGRGLNSIAGMLRNLRHENERTQRLRNAIRDGGGEEFDDLEDDEEVDDGWDDIDIY